MREVEPKQFVAFSGGKDSTALVLRLHELGEPFESPSRDTWPAGLAEMAAEFNKGRIPKERNADKICRVCTL